MKTVVVQTSTTGLGMSYTRFTLWTEHNLYAHHNFEQTVVRVFESYSLRVAVSLVELLLLPRGFSPLTVLRFWSLVMKTLCFR